MAYASSTSVPVERTRSEIEQLLIKYGATEFGSGFRPGQSAINFRIKDLGVRFILPHPDPAEARFCRKKVRGYPKNLTQTRRNNLLEQELRRRWRALLLVVKAKLEAVETGITTLEQEFLAFVILPSNETFGEWILDGALKAIRCGEMPKMLGSGEIQDAEIVQ